MKAMHVISGDLWAGAEVQVFNSLIALKAETDLSLECIIFNEGILSEKLRENNITTVLIDEKKYSILRIVDKICVEIKTWRPDVIHVDLVKEHFASKLAIVKSLKRIPIVRTVHGARKTPDYLPLFKSFRSKIVVFLDNFLITYGADAIIAVSKNLEKEFYKRKVKSSIHQIYNAIKESEYKTKINVSQVKKKYGAEGLFWIGTAARLAEPKNIAMLIKAGKCLAEEGILFKISIFGEGPLRTDLQNLIANLSLAGHVELHGFELEIVPVISSFDVFVLCSIHEGLPMVLLEAMLLNTPIIGTDVVGINEVIEDDKNGLLVPFNDHKALANALLKLYYNKDQAKQYTERAKIIIREKFSLEIMANELFNVYKNIVRQL